MRDQNFSLRSLFNTRTIRLLLNLDKDSNYDIMQFERVFMKNK